MSGKAKTLAQFLKQAREKADLSQRYIADKLGYQSAQFVSNWERGISSPPMKTLKHLGELYHVSAEDLYEIMVEDTLRRVEADLHREFYGAKTRAGARKRA
jgi:transcriptional regulator with XRE-family HTH domain